LILVGLVCAPPSSAFYIDESYDDDTPDEYCGTFWEHTWQTTVTTENAATGTQSCRMAISEGANGWGGGVSFAEHAHSLPKGEELWIRWRMFLPVGYDYGVYGEGDTLKFVRIDFQGGTQRSSFELELTREGRTHPLGIIVPHNPCDSYSDCWDFFGTTADQPQRGVWETWEMYLKIDDVSVDDGGTGRTIMWKNGELIGNQTKINTINEPEHEIVGVRFFTYWNGGAPRTQHLYFDDLVITNERPAATDAEGHPFIGLGVFEPAGDAGVPDVPPARPDGGTDSGDDSGTPVEARDGAPADPGDPSPPMPGGCSAAAGEHGAWPVWLLFLALMVRHPARPKPSPTPPEARDSGDHREP